MPNESAYERIQRVYHLEKKSVNRIVQEEGYCRQTITKVVSQASPKAYQLQHNTPSQSIISVLRKRRHDE